MGYLGLGVERDTVPTPTPSAEEPKKFWYVLGLLTRFDSKNEAISAARFQAKGCPTARYVVMESLCEVVMPKAEPVVLWMK